MQRTARATLMGVGCLAFSMAGRASPGIGAALKRRAALHYDAAVADLMVARRSSIKSRSTSQYLSAESKSLSGGSERTDPLAAILLRP